MGSEVKTACSTCGKCKERGQCGHPNTEVAYRCILFGNPGHVNDNDDNYAELYAILMDAYNFNAVGKGSQRHGSGRPWAQQIWADIVRHHGVGFCLGQVEKKAGEVHSLDTVEAKVNELMGVIGYAAQAIHAIRNGH